MSQEYKAKNFLVMSNLICSIFAWLNIFFIWLSFVVDSGWEVVALDNVNIKLQMSSSRLSDERFFKHYKESLERYFDPEVCKHAHFDDCQSITSCSSVNKHLAPLWLPTNLILILVSTLYNQSWCYTHSIHFFVYFHKL